MLALVVLDAMWLNICDFDRMLRVLLRRLSSEQSYWSSNDLSFQAFRDLKGKVYLAFFLLYSAGVKFCLHTKTYQVATRLCNRCNRSMCLVNFYHAYLSLITSLSFFRPLNTLSLGSSYHSRMLPWAGHVERMSTDAKGAAAVASRLGRTLLTKRLPRDDIG